MTETKKLSTIDNLKVQLVMLGSDKDAEAVQELEDSNKELLKALKRINSNMAFRDRFPDLSEIAKIAVKKAEDK